MRDHATMQILRAISIWTALLLCISSAAAQTTAVKPPDTPRPSKFWSAEDGWLDVSGFLDEKYGFLPIVIPITEPAVGYGAACALAFLSKPLGEARDGFGRRCTFRSAAPGPDRDDPPRRDVAIASR